MLPWWPVLGLLSWCTIFKLNHCNSSEDWSEFSIHKTSHMSSLPIRYWEFIMDILEDTYHNMICDFTAPRTQWFSILHLNMIPSWHIYYLYSYWYLSHLNHEGNIKLGLDHNWFIAALLHAKLQIITKRGALVFWEMGTKIVKKVTMKNIPNAQRLWNLTGMPWKYVKNVYQNPC